MRDIGRNSSSPQPRLTPFNRESRNDLGNTFRLALQSADKSSKQRPPGALDYPTPQGKGSTAKIPAVDADRMRAAIAGVRLLDSQTAPR